LADKRNAFNLADLLMMRSDHFQAQKGELMTVARQKYKGVLIRNMATPLTKPQRATLITPRCKPLVASTLQRIYHDPTQTHLLRL
jgi:hypothetical protein